MKLDIRRFAAIILMVSAFGVTGLAQNQTKPLTPLKVVIVISKY
jgi:hypothetical protein